MKKLSVQEISEILNITPRRVQQMCKTGELKNSKKDGKYWTIPESSICQYKDIPMENSITNSNLKPLPIGISSFVKASSNYYYVDKTLLIKDIIDNSHQATLFTRPRRFGKTLNMDMLKVFFEKTSEDTSIYFKDKLIWNEGEKYTSHQGKYPVIFLSFKDIKCDSWEETYKKIIISIQDEISRHPELVKINDNSITSLYNQTTTQVYYELSLQTLSKKLFDLTNNQVIIIIDEYDTPIQSGYINGFYDKIISFMRNFFSAGLKDNHYLAFGFLSGILRVSKESIFSGLNNIFINSILDNKYNKYFGFTKDEVKSLLNYYNANDKYGEVCEWYDGYHFGNEEIFNPWSLLNYITNDCIPNSFWTSTGSNDIIGEMIDNATPEINEYLHNLLLKKSIVTFIDTNVVFSEVSNPYNIFSFLLLSGYLTTKKTIRQEDGFILYELSIPNKELETIYKKEILDRKGKTNTAINFSQAIYSKDTKKLQAVLEEYLITSISIFDGTNESFFHGMMLGLCAIVSSKYTINSNIESGYGRFDIELKPLSKNIPAFIFELKYVKNESQLNNACIDAINQIEIKKYDTKLKSNGIHNIIKVGIAFSGKKTKIQTIIDTKE